MLPGIDDLPPGFGEDFVFYVPVTRLGHLHLTLPGTDGTGAPPSWGIGAPARAGSDVDEAEGVGGDALVVGRSRTARRRGRRCGPGPRVLGDLDGLADLAADVERAGQGDRAWRPTSG